jgi:hypothetical protein
MIILGVGVFLVPATVLRFQCKLHPVLTLYRSSEMERIGVARTHLD